MNSKENQGHRSPDEIKAAWQKEKLEGTLPPGSDLIKDKQYRTLVINDVNDGFLERYVPVASKGGEIPLTQGMLIEVNSKGVPINETIKERLETNPDGYALENIK